MGRLKEWEWCKNCGDLADNHHGTACRNGNTVFESAGWYAQRPAGLPTDFDRRPATKEVRLSDDELRALCWAIAGLPDCEDLRRKLATALNVETIVTGPQ